VLLDERYEVEELIARGGMATVHRGHDLRLDREVALKIMHPHLADDEQFRRRFSREARSAARLSHPHVVGVFDQGQDGDVVYLTMELVEGGTLRRALASEQSRSLRETLAVTDQVLQALQAAHHAGIVHRDIKPENILLTPSGSVKVADFGLARAIGSSNSSATGTMLGTVAYISPEVVTRGHCDERSDLYSLGVVLYEMLVGTQPYTGEQPVHIAFQHVHEDIPAPSARVPGLPPQIDALVTWACAREPSQRPRSATEMLRTVRGLLAELPDEVLDAALTPASGTDLHTQGVALPTAGLDDVDLEAVPPRQAFPIRPLDLPHPSSTRPTGPGPSTDDEQADGTEAAPSGSDAIPADDENDDTTDEGTRRRTVAMPLPRPPRGRHLRRDRIPTAWVQALALLCAGAVVATGIGGTVDWYRTQGPGANRTVPTLAGTTLADADAALGSQDLDTRTAQQFSSTVPAGHVVSTSPAPGALVKRDTEVTVVISQGEQTFEVPDLQGSTLDEAREAVRSTGLVLVEDDPEFSDEVPAGKVLDQSADAEALPEGGEVHVVLSRGPRMVPVADQTGRSTADAREALEKAGFSVTTSTAHSGSVPKGSVVSQSPDSGSVRPGAAVDLVISSGPEMVAVPDVFKKSEKQAKAALKKAGFSVEVTYDRGKPVLGTVYAQSTPAGKKAAKGSTVTITVF
jgi:beta-lactam-binding protein with PASTA domain/serine/threonine protein kinase